MDLTDCRSLDELHERIRVTLDLPEVHGKNRDSFWDFLRSECDADKLVILGEQTLSKEFEEPLKMMPECLQDFKNNCAKYDGLFEFEIIS